MNGSSPAAAAPGPTPLPIMKGGAKEQILDIIQKYAAPLNIYIGIALVLAISYVGKIPDAHLRFFDSFLGRALLFSGTLFVASLYSWVYAVLLGIFAVLVLSVAPRPYTQEAFENMVRSGAPLKMSSDVKLISQKKKWWIEEVMGENPIGIEEERVETSAIQDNSNSSSSTNFSR